MTVWSTSRCHGSAPLGHPTEATGLVLVRALALFPGCPWLGFSQVLPLFWLGSSKCHSQTLRTSRTRTLSQCQPKGDSHLFRICPWSWGQGSFLPRHTETGLDTWRKGSGCCTVTFPHTHTRQQCPMDKWIWEVGGQVAQRVSSPREEDGRESGAQGRPRGPPWEYVWSRGQHRGHGSRE